MVKARPWFCDVMANAALCAEASRRDEIAARALAFSEAHRGAGARMAQRIAALVGT